MRTRSKSLYGATAPVTFLTFRGKNATQPALVEREEPQPNGEAQLHAFIDVATCIRAHTPINQT